MSTESLNHIGEARQQIFDAISMLNVLSNGWSTSDLYQGEQLILKDVNHRLIHAGNALSVAQRVIHIEDEQA